VAVTPTTLAFTV
jgi:hypothetical protein